MNRQDEIEIRRLAVETHIGVPEEERSVRQTLWVTVRMRPSQGFLGLHDDIQGTVDYYQVSLRIAEIASAKPRHLIETLATDIADSLLANEAISSIDVEIEKRILPNADWVCVRITRERT